MEVRAQQVSSQVRGAARLLLAPLAFEQSVVGIGKFASDGEIREKDLAARARVIL